MITEGIGYRVLLVNFTLNLFSYFGTWGSSGASQSISEEGMYVKDVIAKTFHTAIFGKNSQESK